MKTLTADQVLAVEDLTRRFVEELTSYSPRQFDEMAQGALHELVAIVPELAGATMGGLSTG